MLNLKNCKWNEFPEKIRQKELYCFGSGNLTKWLSFKRCGLHISDKIRAFVDNDSRKEGFFVELDNCFIPIISFDTFVKSKNENTVMLISSMYYAEILKQMDVVSALDGMDCYIEVFLEENKAEASQRDLYETAYEEIPPIIHYCWFGKKEIPQVYKEYINNWKRNCPNYEIVKWDESNYDYKKITYMRQAYDAGKYAFVSDYARLDIIYNYGGIYLDVDVEIVKNLDTLRRNRMFCGFERGNNVATGLGIGAIKNHGLIGELRDIYHNKMFIDDLGRLNLKTCVEYQTEYLEELGLKLNGQIQNIGDAKIYPRTVLAPIDFYGIYNDFSEVTYTIHHYAASWFNTDRKGLLEKNNEIKKRIRMGYV